MRTETLDTLFLEEIQDIRSVEKQILHALIRMAKGLSAQGLWQTLMPLLETTEHRGNRLERAASRAREANAPNLALLTTREGEVLELIAKGYANKQIAAELEISIKTVEKHRQRMMAKLDLHDTAGVTRYAISAGIVDAGL